MRNIDISTPLIVSWNTNDGWNDSYDATVDSNAIETTILELYQDIKTSYGFDPNYEPIYEIGECDDEGDPVTNQAYTTAMARGLKAYEAGTHGSIVNDVISWINEGDDGYVQTLEKYQTNIAECTRQKMESVATKYARKWNVTAGSLTFVQELNAQRNIINDKLERFNNEENRAERWAAHTYYGNTHEFFNNEEYDTGKYYEVLNELDLIETWLYQNCPLLMACVEEQQLATER